MLGYAELMREEWADNEAVATDAGRIHRAADHLKLSDKYREILVSFKAMLRDARRRGLPRLDA